VKKEDRISEQFRFAGEVDNFRVATIHPRSAYSLRDSNFLDLRLGHLSGTTNRDLAKTLIRIYPDAQAPP